MKKMIMVLTLVGMFSVGTIAEAAWHDVVGVRQVKNIGLCILADAGKIGTSIVVHTAGLITEVITSVRDCLTFVVDEITPDDEPSS